MNEQVKEYLENKITPKGMIQIFVGQDIPRDALHALFCAALKE